MLEPYFKPDCVEAGCDEAGRGCLAGPVYAAAVILPPDICERNSVLAQALNDSKQLTERRRSALRSVIEKEAVAWAVVAVDNKEIDQLNILRSSIIAMHRALDKLEIRPENIILSGDPEMLTELNQINLGTIDAMLNDLMKIQTNINHNFKIPLIYFSSIGRFFNGEGRYL